MEKLLHIAPHFSISAYDYANQANAILGIREAGKTYTAMKAAEQLLDNDIPIICFDPVGVWKNLKIGTGKNVGYPVVVAGGDGSDIRLTKENAVDIVRAAMKENVSLVIDLYSPELINKSTWIAIVQSVVDLLMYENKAYGLRHIFVEEAAEFIPQKLQPQHARVYASLERLARMGRNAKLGMTIINQRAEEVNKAILEICELSLIHKQVGKNSLLAIQKWLDVRQLQDVKAIIKSLPLLKKGECWAVGLSDQPQRIQVAKKNTFHPDPKASNDEKVQASFIKRDVGSFVSKMNKQLEKEREEKAPKKSLPASVQVDNTQSDLFRETIAKLKDQLAHTTKLLEYWKMKCFAFRGYLDNLKRAMPEDDALQWSEPEYTTIDQNNSKSGAINSGNVPNNSKSVQKIAPIVSTGNGKLEKCSLAILRFLGQFPDRSFTKAQISVAIGYSSTSSSFSNSMSQINSLGLITKSDGRISVADLSRVIAYTGTIVHQVYDAHTFKAKLEKCEGQIYDILLANPNDKFSKESLAAETESNYSPTSSSFGNALSRLNTLELIKRENGQIKLNPELLELV